MKSCALRVCCSNDILSDMWDKICHWCDTPVGTTVSLVIVLLCAVVVVQAIALMYMQVEHDFEKMEKDAPIESSRAL